MQSLHVNLMASLFLMAIFLGACAPSQPRLEAGSFPERARQLLEEQAELGPVAFESRIADTDTRLLADAAKDGIRGIDVEFIDLAGRDAAFRLVVALEADPCALESPLSGGITVAFCRNDEIVASSRGPLDEELETLVRRASRQIFPDAYAQRRSFGLFGGFGTGISVGVGTSIGF